MKIYGSIIMAGVLSVGVFPEAAQCMDEVIEVNGCAPGWTLIEAGDNWWCVADPSPTTPPGDGGGGGEDGGGGGSDGVPTSDFDWEEVKRVWNCGRCKVSAQKCRSEAKRGESLCIEASIEQARWRCDPLARGSTQTLTAWGCSLPMHVRGLCSGVEAPFDEEAAWDYTCKGLPQCEGPAINNCFASWANSHPGGSTQIVDTGTLTANFNGFGATASKTITATFNVAPRRGFLWACASAGNQLMTGCVTEQQACYSQYSCTPADLGEL